MRAASINFDKNRRHSWQCSNNLKGGIEDKVSRAMGGNNYYENLPETKSKKTHVNASGHWLVFFFLGFLGVKLKHGFK